MTQIGLRARQLRARRGESQEAVARRADISTATYIRLENGKGQPSLDTLIKVAEALQVTVDELLAPTAA